MRDLKLTEIELVEGGYSPGAGAADGAAIGSIIGYTIYGTLAGATRCGAMGALVGGTYAFSNSVASAVYPYTLQPLVVGAAEVITEATM